MCIFSSADRKHEILRGTLCGEKKTDSLRSLFSIKGPFLVFFKCFIVFRGHFYIGFMPPSGA